MLKEFYITRPFNEETLKTIDIPSRVIIRSTEIIDLKQYETFSSVLIFFKNESQELKKIPANNSIPVSIYFERLESTLPPLPHTVKVFLDLRDPDCFEKVKMLSLSSIHSGIYLNRKCKINWESVLNLFDFYISNVGNIAPIEPFHFIINSFNKRRFANFNNLYFNNSSKYLHIDDKGGIAMTLEDLFNGRVIGNIHSDTETVIRKRIENYNNGYHKFFITRHECSFCEGWSICNGSFLDDSGKGDCRKFFVRNVNYVNTSINEKVSNICEP